MIEEEGEIEEEEPFAPSRPSADDCFEFSEASPLAGVIEGKDLAAEPFPPGHDGWGFKLDPHQLKSVGRLASNKCGKICCGDVSI